MAPLDVLGTQDGIHPIVGEPFRRLVLREHFSAGEQEIAEGLAADELMDPVMDDALLRVIPERGERVIEDRHRRHAALSWIMCAAEATACLATPRRRRVRPQTLVLSDPGSRTVARGAWGVRLPLQ